MRLFAAPLLALTALLSFGLGTPVRAEDCGNPALSDADSATMTAVAAKVDAGLHQQLAAYAFSPESSDPGAVWTNQAVYSSCQTKAVGYSYSAQWQVTAPGGDPTSDAATIRLYADMNPWLQQAPPSEGSPGLAIYPTPTGAVAAFSQTPDPGNSNGVFEVRVLVGAWVLGKDENDNPQYHAVPGGFTRPDSANAMLLTVDGDPATLEAFFKTFDASKLGL